MTIKAAVCAALLGGFAFASSAYDLGFDAKIDGDYETAIEHFTQAIKEDPKNADAYTLRSSVYESLGDYKSAIVDLSAVIKLKPDDAASYNNRAILYGQSGDLANAEKDARKACQLKTCDALNFMQENGLLGK
ncbi:MAG: tetratricopeptide repeat protein [Helicobacteraceae bacterium]|jgi:Flp pilus assembly protein TadD|nr:tetratricopeptide repeat protein [Helicobacteraceae bacterium]